MNYYIHYMTHFRFNSYINAWIQNYVKTLKINELNKFINCYRSIIALTMFIYTSYHIMKLQIIVNATIIRAIRATNAIIRAFSHELYNFENIHFGNLQFSK